MGVLRGYLPGRWPGWLDPELLSLGDGPFGPFAASERLTRDGTVRVVATPGHTPDHVSVLVEDGAETVMLAGDTSYSEALMLGGKIDGISMNAAVTARTLAAIREFAADRPLIYLPTHDPESADRLARRQIVPLFKPERPYAS
jgi:glyoxylase-like metal-dependent hydrolase (beta-lactamase superfamily II)